MIGGTVATDPYRRIDVSTWALESVEPGGKSENVWLRNPEDGIKWLRKLTLIPSNGEEQGEDWAEVLSTQVAYQLGVPCAPTRLCRHDGRRGVLSQNIRPDDSNLYGGVAALQDCPLVTDFISHTSTALAIDPNRPGVRRPGHTLANVRLALQNVGPPPDFPATGHLEAFDVFAGYLILDSLIANRDRHQENWAVLYPQLKGGTVRLSPTFDHASSLGFNLRDQKRGQLVSDHQALATWAEKGTAIRFEHRGNPPTLVTLAADALRRCSRDGQRFWRARLLNLDLASVYSALDDGRIPEMSDVACRFVNALLEHNLGRLRHEIARID